MAATTPAALRATERPHVLVVSDDEGLRSFLTEGLIFGGFWTSAVASGIQVLEVFRLRSFDLVLIDGALAGLGALEVVRRLRGRSSRAASDAARTDVPILLVVGDPAEADPTIAAEIGADGVLSAPIDLEQLVPDLHAVVQRWRTDHPGRPMADAAAAARPSQT